MANWWQAIPVAITQEDLDCAWRWASVVTEQGDSGDIQQNQASRYWSPFEANQYGHVCEHVFHRFTGAGLLRCDAASPRTGGALGTGDVGKWEVKGAPWRSITHFHLTQGGRVFVPDHVRRPIAAVSYFLGSPLRGWIDGWVPWQQAMHAPLGGRVRGKSGKRAHVIRYAELRPAEEILAQGAGYG
jgi:hypothetical protein